MTRETCEHVAELAAMLAQAESYKGEHGTISPVPWHVAAREAVALAAVARKVHRLAEDECNGAVGEAVADKRRERYRKAAEGILARFGLTCAFQGDPRGWPILVYAGGTDAEAAAYCGSPRELLRVTPHA